MKFNSWILLVAFMAVGVDVATVGCNRRTHPKIEQYFELVRRDWKCDSTALRSSNGKEHRSCFYQGKQSGYTTTNDETGQLISAQAYFNGIRFGNYFYSIPGGVEVGFISLDGDTCVQLTDSEQGFGYLRGKLSYSIQNKDSVPVGSHWELIVFSPRMPWGSVNVAAQINDDELVGNKEKLWFGERTIFSTKSIRLGQNNAVLVSSLC